MGTAGMREPGVEFPFQECFNHQVLKVGMLVFCRRAHRRGSQLLSQLLTLTALAASRLRGALHTAVPQHMLC